MDYVIVLFWALIGSAVSLVGGIVLLSNSRLREKAVQYGMPFGAGALLAAAFLGVLPEAIEGSDIHTALLCALGGFLGFFVLERLLSWFHHHEPRHHDDHRNERNATHQWLIIVGDTLHNAIDGIAIGAAFLVSPAAGIGTAIAVAAHEIPQEIGDFGILLGKGMKARNVLLVNLMSALATVATAVATYALGDAMQFDASLLLAVAAGFFIYIAASDVIPDIHGKSRREGNIQAAILFVGVALVAVVVQLTPHSHGDEGVTIETAPHSELHDYHDEHEHGSDHRR